jgi:hypothetical protein
VWLWSVLLLYLKLAYAYLYSSFKLLLILLVRTSAEMFLGAPPACRVFHLVGQSRDSLSLSLSLVSPRLQSVRTSKRCFALFPGVHQGVIIRTTTCLALIHHPRLRTRRRASGTMAASRGPSGPLRGSPLPRGRMAGWFAPT